jgi:hypothetical protein
MIAEKEVKLMQEQAYQSMQQKAHLTVETINTRLQKKEEEKKAKTEDGTKAVGAGSSVELRRENRKQRKIVLEAHMKQRPNQNDDDERDVLAIDQATKTMGDYKLKCADDYVSTSDERIDANTKKCEIALLEESIVNLRLEYNDRFLHLRELKRQIITAAHSGNQRIKEINDELVVIDSSSATSKYGMEEYRIDPIEYPDDRDEINLSDLTKYKESRKTLPWLKAIPTIHSITTGTKTIIERVAATGELKVSKSNNSSKYGSIDNLVIDPEVSLLSSATSVASNAPKQVVPPVIAALNEAKKRSMLATSPTYSQQEYNHFRKNCLLHEKQKLIDIHTHGTGKI